MSMWLTGRKSYGGLKENPNVAQKIEEVRKQTRDEKKRLQWLCVRSSSASLECATNEKGKTRCVAREEKNLANFLEMSPDRQIENCYETEGPFYWTTMALAVWSHNSGDVAVLRCCDGCWY
ncbi:hypothetical protein HPB51_029160 [Rhipicephalus microplus]|uniref:E3 ubiquitin ligase UBR4 C-terminal domain-containing protein n=1 Tax=Rhipicephalus microplus TaxID=6941 RepID=A0A9J6CVN2_RHIMP|nr:hypothetical protein HPB51_029160 [Rhipicephalus microplus]